MPEVFVPEDVATSFLAFMEAQGTLLPPALVDLQSRFVEALARGNPGSPSTPIVAAQTHSIVTPSPCFTRPAPPPTLMESPRRPTPRHVAFTSGTRRAQSVPLDTVGISNDFTRLLSEQRASPSSSQPHQNVLQIALTTPSTLHGRSESPEPGSSPTIQGSSPASKVSISRLPLSPLRLDVLTTGPLTPSPPTSPRAPSRLGKRRSSIFDHEDDEDEDEDESQPHTQRSFFITIPAPGDPRRIRGARARRIGGAGGGDDDGGGGGGGGGGYNPPAHLWTEECSRRGDRERVGSDADIGSMPCGQENCRSCDEGDGAEHGAETNEQPSVQGGASSLQNNSQTGKRKRRKVGWRVDEDGGPPITEGAGLLLGKLLSIFGRAHRQALEEVLAGPGLEDGGAGDGHDMSSVVASLQRQSKSLKHGELQFMLSLVQLALNVDSLKADAKLKYLPRVTIERLADLYAKGTHRNTFQDWVSWGKRLLLLCAGGTLYILPIIAALDLRTHITRKSTSEADILSLATALRRAKHGMWLPMVHRFMVPVFHMRSLEGYIQTLQLHYQVPLPVGQIPRSVSFGFQDWKESDSIFDRVVTEYPVLAERSSDWASRADEWQTPSQCMPSWKPLEDPRRSQLAPIRLVKTPLRYKKSQCPVTKKNRDRWTEEQRKKAEHAIVAESIEDLDTKLADLHEGGTTKLGQYIEINSEILAGHALHITDANGKLLSLLFTVPLEYRQQLADAIMHIHACMPGEFKDDDSRREFFKYLSCHYSWYARYAEKGTTAPKDSHPDNVRKDHRGRVNFEQRFPHASKEMRNTEEYALLAEAYTDFFEILRVALKEYLPEETDELSIYVEHLPLDASSPCYPFGGFVINLSDKRICLVVPFGTFTGGQLCLYETGFCFNLKPGDVLVFPSCDLTHFNLHFKGQRGTLVLHSDRQGDSWVRTCNGWSTHVVRHS
ncbi:hypothetical protein B0H11DRAFT_2189430 [Mycena galericulata]|nr:hypothetical protein B0H11DRAFT_2189430 [Mycena galericulata]